MTTEKTPLSKHVLFGIALHLDYLMDGIIDGSIKSEPGDYEVIKRIFYSIDGFDAISAFATTPAHAFDYEATLELMQEALGKFYYEITQEAK